MNAALIQERQPHTPHAGRGQPGDFDFLTGRWTIQNRRLVDQQWDRFKSEASVVGILGGIASVEELRIPARDFGGMGLRLLDLERGLWADHWVNRKSGVLPAAPTWGGFADGVGRWDCMEIDEGKPLITRGVWDQITPDSCRWYQAVSRDGGASWQENWIMLWTRVRPSRP